MSNVGGVSGAQQEERVHYFQSNTHPRYGYVAWFIILTFLFWILLMLKGPKFVQKADSSVSQSRSLGYALLAALALLFLSKIV